MIVLTRLNGQDLGVDSDLIERAETTPDTVLTLVDGTKYVVAESVLEVIDRVRTATAWSLVTAGTRW
jgi:flagellar protein FlbD